MEIGGINREDFPELTLLVNVWDAFNVPVPDLTADDFNITIDGSPATILSVENVTGNELPISVVLVVDTSESMTGLPLENAQQAALAFLDNLALADEVALIDFDSTVKLAQDFTTDLDAVRSAIEGLTADGATALWDAAYTAADVASQANTPRRFVVFLTDGNNYGSLSTHFAEDAVTLAQDQNIQFYTFGIGYGIDPNYLQELAESTRGLVLLSPTSETLTAQYAYLASYLRTQYVIRVGTELEPDGAAHDVEVMAGDTSAQGDFESPDLYPQLTLDGLPEGAFEEPVTLTAEITAPRGIGTQSVLIDGEPVDVSFEPFVEGSVQASLTLDPFDFEPGVEHTLTIQATDAEGGSRETSASFTVADLAPEITISGLDEGAVVSEGSITVSVSVDRAQQPVSAVIARVDGQEAARVDGEPFDLALDLLPFGPGQHTLQIAVVDPSGETTFDRTFTLDPALFVTPTATPTNTPTVTPSPTPSDTSTPTSTPSETPTNTPTDTPSPTETPTPTATVTDTPQPTSTASATAAPSDTPEPSLTPTTEPTEVAFAPEATSEERAATQPPTRTPRPTRTPTDTPTDTPQPTNTATDTPEPTATRTPRPTNTPSNTPTDTPTNTP
ncbi:MAG TPA: VWA domain-containing protein, partial [Aggregatilinea sp.]|uniref:vWA domain-containing protein n=1 Tax=Aggregatilinea sp. TaxID=2806333 RepID=UPI002C34146A